MEMIIIFFYHCFAEVFFCVFLFSFNLFSQTTHLIFRGIIFHWWWVYLRMYFEIYFLLWDNWKLKIPSASFSFSVQQVSLCSFGDCRLSACWDGSLCLGAVQGNSRGVDPVIMGPVCGSISCSLWHSQVLVYVVRKKIDSVSHGRFD